MDNEKQYSVYLSGERMEWIEQQSINEDKSYNEIIRDLIDKGMAASD